MNKKGFTLTELLSVIVILALISLMASTGIIKLANNSKENMYCAKIKLIETEAEEYAIKYERELNESDKLYNGYKSLTFKINDLVENGTIEADKDNNIINPIDNSIMNDTEIIIYLKNNQINAYIDNNICEN
ncbi:MAG: prepilin-type N-terminal cleavage/methylation domain-containing protein [Firmicutes bacterium]|nr:prepilin-type N-terminal cleavage/methylation domain-containing protein [Bacillota bacterium]